MASDTELPIPESRILETVRAGLSSSRKPDGTPVLPPGAELRVGGCVPLPARDGQGILGYRVVVLVNPRLGVPCNQPDAEPAWVASTVFVAIVDPRGERILPNPNPSAA